MAIELPIFLLNVVLFPGAELPLHIFEPRYRLMINECYGEKKPFGVVLARPESEYLQEEPYPVGTMAEIEVLEPVGRWPYEPDCQGLAALPYPQPAS